MDNSQSETSTEISRRQFVVLAAGCAALCSCAGMAMAAPTSDNFDAGPITDFAKDGINDKFVKSQSVFIIREDKKIFASSAICTHKGATLKVRNGEIWCPKHGSTFSEDGAVTKGPAESSLERYAVKKNDAGHLIVDFTKSFHEKNWSDPASFVAV
jgi:nitrite reductase/ring-hydroxylating ferredoxin subunit